MQKFSPKSIRFYIDEFDKRLAELQSVAGIVAKTETSVKNSADASAIFIGYGKAFQELVDKLNAEYRELNVMLKDCDYQGN